ncbi:radical SAM protein [Nonomuraea sp. NPDC005650]|uniref:radical SAM protein n=1 Tax=Nonomuraea sp. NPDC005650 TaxID=3157045 RepID=UPI0033ADCE0E
MRRLTLADTDELRATPGATVVLFLTDRCPVGCAHCSVASRPDGPSITDRELFVELVAGIAATEEVRAVAVTGGEPFAERFGLRHAVRALSEAGKDVVLFTSGYWASAGPPRPWVRSVLRSVSTVFLSVDGFHLPFVDRDRVRSAMTAIRDADCHLILQTLGEPDPALAGDSAEVNVITPIPQGRGREVFRAHPYRPLVDLGPCPLVKSPTVRYDGTVTACCDEAVIMGAGPSGLRTTVRSRAEVPDALRAFRHAPLLRVIGSHGPRALVSLLGAGSTYRNVCGACWRAHRIVERSPLAERLVTAVAALPRGGRRAS